MPHEPDLLQQTLDPRPCWQALPAQPHTPDFRVVPMSAPSHAPSTEWWWIYDGPQKIGLLQTWTKEIEMFRFTRTPDGAIVDYALPAIHHFATLIGAKINLYAPDFSVRHEPVVIEWRRREGPVLEFKTVDRMDNGAEGDAVFCLAWDDMLGYVWHCDHHIRMQAPGAMEFNNLLAGGVSDSRDDRKRWQKVLRGGAPEGLAWFYLNPVNLPGNALASNGFVGFVREPDMNPFVALEHVNTTVHLATCDQWYDQHFIADAPATPEADDRYHIRARYRFLSLPAPVAEALEELAQPINTGATEALGFRSGMVNDFEHGIHGGEVFNGFIWQRGFVDRTRGHSGTVSLKAVGAGCGRPVIITRTTAGAGIYSESAKRYRLSAWIKTELKAGEAYLQVDDCIWTWRDVRATRRSGGIGGYSDWTEVTVEFQPGAHDPFLVINLCVDGTGDAWFDDVALTAIE